MLLLCTALTGEYYYVAYGYESQYLILLGYPLVIMIWRIYSITKATIPATKHNKPKKKRTSTPEEFGISPKKANSQQTTPRTTSTSTNTILSVLYQFFPIIPSASSSLNSFLEAPDSPMILARSPIDKQRRLGIDKSKGFREWEYYHRLSAGTDKDRGDSQFNGVLDGKIDLWDIPELKEGLKEVGSLLEQTAKSQSITQNQLNYYAENLAAHSQAIKNLNENTLKNSMTIDKLNIVLDKINTSLSEQPTPKPSWLGRLLGRKPKG